MNQLKQKESMDWANKALAQVAGGEKVKKCDINIPSDSRGRSSSVREASQVKVPQKVQLNWRELGSRLQHRRS